MIDMYITKKEIVYSDRDENYGAYLVRALNIIAIAYLKFPNTLMNLEKIFLWRKEQVHALPMSTDMGLQVFSCGDIDDAYAIEHIAQHAADKAKITKEEAIVPFVGGISKFSDRGLYKTLWNVSEQKEPYLNDYVRAAEEYYYNHFMMLKETEK